MLIPAKAWWTLSPFALNRKGSPVIRLFPLRVFQHRELGCPQGCRRAQLFRAQQSSVEACHQYTGGGIVDAPEADNQARCSGVHEAACKANEPFAIHHFALTGLASAQHD